MYSYADISSYYRKYCSYYQTLEADFVATERYLTIDEDNFFAFSNEYIKLIQAICSEVDVVAKYILHLLCKNASKDDSTYFLNEWYQNSKLFCSFVVAGI